MAKRKGIAKFKLFKKIFGPEIANESLSFALKRDELESKYYSDKRVLTQSGKLRLKGNKIDSNRMVFNFVTRSLEVDIVSDGLFHFTWLSDGEVLPKFREELTVVKKNISADFDFTQTKDFTLISNNDVDVKVLNNGAIEYVYRGETLRTDSPPSITSSGVVHRSKIRTRSMLFGTGERALPFNLRGNKLSLWNHDPNGSYGPGVDPIYISIPMIVDVESGTGYGILYINPSKGSLDLCRTKKDVLVTEFNFGQLEYYVAFGNTQEILEKFAEITGYPMLPPKWSFGFHQSKYSYMNQQQIVDVVENFHRLHLPLSAIHMDIDYMEGFRVFTLNERSFPAINSLSLKLKSRGISLVSILDPAVKWDENYEVFKEIMNYHNYVMDPEGGAIGAPVWAGKSVFPDFSSEKTRKWWASWYSFFVTKGVDGVWHDMNEPVVFSLWGDNSLPLHAVHEKGLHSEIHNIYALYMANAGFEGMTNNGNGKRPFLLSRSGWAGIQKYSFVWTGDTESTWAGLKQTVPTILNLSLSGIPYTGVDIGGFSGTPSKDLFTRWFQLGSFLPLFRVHSSKGVGEREPWAYGKEALKIIRKSLEMRYSLLPYWFSVAYECHISGHPMIRPISYHYPKVFDANSFMVGESILVYPVLEESVEQMTINLPPGRWYSLWDSTVNEGTISLLIEESSIPVFIREGSVIPREDRKLHFDIYPPGDFTFTFYEDDDKLNPKFRKIRFSGKSVRNLFKLEYEKEGELSKNEEVLLTLKDNNFVFKKNGRSQLRVSKQKEIIEIIPKAK